MENCAKSRQLFFFLCSACVDDKDKLIFFNTDKGLSYKNYTDMRKDLLVFFPHLKYNKIKNSEDQFRKNMKEFSKGQYDIAQFEKPEYCDRETKKKRKKIMKYQLEKIQTNYL